MPSAYRQKNKIVHAIRGCAKSAAPDVLYVARIDVYRLQANRSDFLRMKFTCYIRQLAPSVRQRSTEGAIIVIIFYK